MWYRGAIPFQELHRAYQSADAFVFASSCENLPNILLEAMASGLPIACSNRGPMPEELRDAGVYFNPESPSDIEAALRVLLDKPATRATIALKAHAPAREHTWKRCATDTFDFIQMVMSKNDHNV